MTYEATEDDWDEWVKEFIVKAEELEAFSVQKARVDALLTAYVEMANFIEDVGFEDLSDAQQLDYSRLEFTMDEIDKEFIYNEPDGSF